MSNKLNSNINNTKVSLRFQTSKNTVFTVSGSKTRNEEETADPSRFYAISKTVSTASISKTCNEEEVTLIAKPIDETKSKMRASRFLKYKYNGVRVTRTKRINALRNILK